MVIVVILLAAVQVLLVALVIRLLWQCGAPASRTSETRVSTTAPFVRPGGAITRPPRGVAAH